MSTGPASGRRAAVPQSAPDALARRLGAFDATMIVMGGIIGSGIFMNPYVVARQVHTPLLILGAWAVGGAIALLGALIYAELSARRPAVGGQYACLREAYHPALAFVYAWGLLLVTQTGGMAAVAVTFARYFRELTGVAAPDGVIAAAALAALTMINMLGVRAGGTTQNAFMVLKLAAIAALVGAGFAFARPAAAVVAPAAPAPSFGLLTAFGAAMVPVLFAYGGWQTAPFVATEVREPQRALPLGILVGVAGVVAVYLAVNAVALRVLGPAGLAATTTPATDVMRRALGETGARVIAAGIAISTLGFLAQSMLTAPRVYFAMARDGLFFRGVARVDPKTHAPVVAVFLQGALAVALAFSGQYERILSYVVPVDWIFFALAAGSLFALRRHDRGWHPAGPGGFTTPGHPWTTLAFIAVSACVVANTLYRYPVESAIGIGLLLAGLPAYLLWRPRRAPRRPAA
jgi:APA family basic amino acid/polyamine antiporter